MEVKISQELYNEIGDLIQSSESPVGIDAKKTHIIIIEKLMRIEERLTAIEKGLQS